MLVKIHRALINTKKSEIVLYHALSYSVFTIAPQDIITILQVRRTEMSLSGK